MKATFSQVRHPSHPGHGCGSLTCHMTHFEQSDWLRSPNLTNIMIELILLTSCLCKGTQVCTPKLFINAQISFEGHNQDLQNHVSLKLEWSLYDKYWWSCKRFSFGAFFQSPIWCSKVVLYVTVSFGSWRYTRYSDAELEPWGFDCFCCCCCFCFCVFFCVFLSSLPRMRKSPGNPLVSASHHQLD